MSDSPSNAASRQVWSNTIVGILDAAFHLSEEELFFTAEQVRQLLSGLRIPQRGTPTSLPASVALEAAAGLFSQQMHGPRDAGLHRPVRAVSPADVVVTLEAWREALMGLFVAAYPTLDPYERLGATKILDELLVGLGIPYRAAAHVPAEVVLAHLNGA